MLRIIVKKTFDLLGFTIAWKQPWMNNHKWMNEQNIETVIDIGANEGQYAKFIRKILPNALIYSFEPLPEVFNKLLNNHQSDKMFKAFNYGLGIKEESIEMNLNEFSPSSSLLEMTDLHKNNVPLAQKTTKTQIRIRTLDSFINEMSLSENILIKIDVQGFEDQVINGGLNTLKLAKAVCVEVSFQELYKNQPLFDDIYSKLISLGFIYRGNLEIYFDNVNGAPIYGDALFLKP